MQAVPMRFSGSTYNAPRDEARLTGQWLAVFDFMRHGKWHTLAEISTATGYPEASISARLRDFRKPRFGGHTVDREYVSAGLYRYRLIVEG